MRNCNQPSAQAPKPGTKDGQDFTQTATIRNSVNVKKDTIKLEPLEGDPTKLRISFSFDCTQPCCVTTYVCAQEDVETFKLTPRYQTPASCCIYEKGVRETVQGEESYTTIPFVLSKVKAGIPVHAVFYLHAPTPTVGAQVPKSRRR